MASYRVLDGMSIFDVAINTYGNASFAVQLLQDNPTNFPDWNTIIPGDVFFDETQIVKIVPGIQLTADAVDDGQRSIKGIANQSIFDVAMVTYGTIDKVVELIRDSDNLPLSYILADDRTFYFNLNKTSDINLYIFLSRPGTAVGGTIDMTTNVTGKAYKDDSYSNGYN